MPRQFWPSHQKQALREGTAPEKKIKDEAHRNQELKERSPEEMEGLAKGEKKDVPGLVEGKVDPVQGSPRVGAPRKEDCPSQEQGAAQHSRSAPRSVGGHAIRSERFHASKMRRRGV
jgi:hypothetical protein